MIRYQQCSTLRLSYWTPLRMFIEKERGRCLIITGIRRFWYWCMDLKYMYIYISLADMPSMWCMLICTLIYVFGHGYNCCYIGLDSSVIDSGRVPDMKKKKGVLCSISRVAHGKFTFFLPWKCRFNSAWVLPDARLMYFLFLFIDYSEKLLYIYLPAYQFTPCTSFNF